MPDVPLHGSVKRPRPRAPFIALCLLSVALVVSHAHVASEDTGSVAVLVFADEGRSMPVAGAEVTLTTTWTRVDEDGAPGLSAVTSDDGACLFEHVPAGRYVLRAAKPGFVTATYGTSPEDAEPIAVVVAPGGRVVPLDIVLAPGASISGRVRDARGEPVRQAIVRLMELTTADGQFAATSAAADQGAVVRAETDDTGMYRLHGVPSGTYLVYASVVGQVDAAARPVMARAYYPASTNASGAAPLDVGAAQDLTGIDIYLQPTTLANVAGAIAGFSSSDGRRLRVLMVPEGLFATADRERHAGAVIESGDVTFTNPIRTSDDGRFVVHDVAPGQYEIWARSVPADALAEVDAAPVLWGHGYVTVGSDDVSGVSIALQPGASVSGRVATLPTTSGALASKAVVTLVPTEPVGLRSRLLRVSAPVNAGGAFRMTSVVPGRYSVAVSGPDGEWAIIEASGRDVRDRPFDVAPDEAIMDVLLRVTTPAPPITGVLLDETNAPLAGLRIVVVPDDAPSPPASAYRMRRVKTATDGTFAVAGLAPGRYRVAAATGPIAEPLAQTALEELSRAGVPVTLTIRAAAPIVLRVARARPNASAQ